MNKETAKISGIITRTLPKFATQVSKKICVEMTISKKKWCILFAYIPPQNNNLKTFFEEINLSWSTIVNKHDNIILRLKLEHEIEK